MSRKKFKPMDTEECGFPPAETPTEPGVYYAFWPENRHGDVWGHIPRSELEEAGSARRYLARRWRAFRGNLGRYWCSHDRFVERWLDGQYEFYVIVPEKENDK